MPGAVWETVRAVLWCETMGHGDRRRPRVQAGVVGLRLVLMFSPAPRAAAAVSQLRFRYTVLSNPSKAVRSSLELAAAGLLLLPSPRAKTPAPSVLAGGSGSIPGEYNCRPPSAMPLSSPASSLGRLTSGDVVWCEG